MLDYNRIFSEFKNNLKNYIKCIYGPDDMKILWYPYIIVCWLLGSKFTCSI